MRLRRKIGLAVAAFLGVLLLAIGLVPYVVDVEAYRPVIIEAVRDATGRELVIDGPVSKRRLLAEDVTASATVGSFDGPFTLDGSATVNGVPLTLAFSVEAPTDKGHATKLSLEVSSGKLAFEGQISAIRPDADINGH